MKTKHCQETQSKVKCESSCWTYSNVNNVKSLCFVFEEYCDVSMTEETTYF